MSLSSHIGNRQSPVRAYFEKRLGDAKAVVGEANAALRDGRASPPVAPCGTPFLVGTAVDILLNAWLDPTSPPTFFNASPTADGAVLVAESQRALMKSFAGRRVPREGEWGELAAHALLLARCVTAYRSRDGRRLLRERLVDVPASLDAYATRLWDRKDQQDAVALAAAAFDDLAGAVQARQIVVNPTFGLSGALGGADADVVLDGTCGQACALGSDQPDRRAFGVV
ncbi:MAG TPA: hypothetical protein VGM91_12140 [Conexibacter sp.]|jgi:hypothetical protein